MEDPNELLRKLYEMLTNQGRQEKSPTTSNPKKYPRSIKIDPSMEIDETRKQQTEELLLILSKMDHLRRRLDDLCDEANMCMHNMQATRTEFFTKARRTYPRVITRDGSERGSGWREWKGDYYLVAWDSDEDDPSDSEPHGNYI